MKENSRSRYNWKSSQQRTIKYAKKHVSPRRKDIVKILGRLLGRGRWEEGTDTAHRLGNNSEVCKG